MTIMKKILIANRSEIARRIQVTCHARGLKTIAVFEQNDAASAYVASADQAFRLSGSGFGAYQDQEELIEIALRAGADAVHPGYGFLAENSSFAQKVIDAGLIWVGPHPAIITLMGDKHHARLCAVQAGIPVIPAGIIQHARGDESERACEVARSIGFPVMLKDPLGGGGKGMRRVDDEQDLAASWQRVCSEAKKLTGGDSILIEKYLDQVRHIEVQIAGDGKTWIHLHERECSLQRRHQKIVEEAPSKFVSQSTLEKMYAAALKLAQHVQYTSVGTVEFIVTPDEQFYFLEMNTRLQVEHSITELTTGIDLVGLQFDVACHGVLPLKQDEVMRIGHALECRIYAENPEQNFMPATGIIHHLDFPSLPFGRLDHDLYEGLEITPFFDPMIAKISTYGKTREQATALMLAALKQWMVDGVITNIHFLENLLQQEFFINGKFHTQLLADKNLIRRVVEFDMSNEQLIPQEHIALIGAMLQLEQSQKSKPKSKQDQRDGWRYRQWE